MFYMKVVLKNFAIFTRKHLCQEHLRTAASVLENTLHLLTKLEWSLMK